MTLDLRPDWGWGVTVFLADEDPAEACISCFGSKAFPMPEEVTEALRDSIFLVWGGNSISDPVVH